MELLLLVTIFVLFAFVVKNAKVLTENYISKQIIGIKVQESDMIARKTQEKILGFSMTITLLCLVFIPIFSFLDKEFIYLLSSLIFGVLLLNILLFSNLSYEYKKINEIKKNKNKLVNKEYIFDMMKYVPVDKTLYINDLIHLRSCQCKDYCCLLNVLAKSTILIGFVTVQTIIKQTELEKFDKFYYAWESFAPINLALFFVK